MTGYSSHFSTKKTPQSRPVPGKDMVKNSAGGYTFSISDWERLDRFLILGNEGGSYYASERRLTVENAECVVRCLSVDVKRTVDRIVEISEAGRAAKNDPAIFALAICASPQFSSDTSYALSKLNNVCRIGTHIFQFTECVQNLRGWGRSLKKAVANWYTSKSVDKLGYQVTKYQQRGGWSHKDLLRLSHPRSEEHNSIFKYITNKDNKLDTPEMLDYLSELPEIILAAEQAKKVTTKKEIISLIENNGLVRECIPTKWLNDADVWNALLQKMPMGAMIRNLGKMSNVGLLKPMSQASQLVVQKLSNQELIQKSKLHPLSILITSSIYNMGRGIKGKLTWSPDSGILSALDSAFNLAFDNVVPTGKRHLIGLDVSGSMGSWVY
jgi:60 kDa SS-A/Ro ribonucleoprotein